MEKHEADPDDDLNRVGGIDKGLNCEIKQIDYESRGIKGSQRASKERMTHQTAYWALANSPKTFIGSDPDC